MTTLLLSLTFSHGTQHFAKIVTKNVANCRFRRDLIVAIRNFSPNRNINRCYVDKFVIFSLLSLEKKISLLRT